MRVVDLLVERLGVVQEVEGGVEQVGSGLEVGGGGLQSGLELLALLGDVAESLTDLGGGDVAVRGEVDEVRFLAVEPGQSSLGLVREQRACGLLVVQRLAYPTAYVLDELRV